MGLYDDDKASVTGGDVLDVIYWQTKFANEKVEHALKTRQPEHPIRLELASLINGCNDVLKTYPNHADVKKWKEKAETIQKKIDPNAASADWKSNFGHFRDFGYEAGWRHYHIAKMAAKDQDWGLAHSHASESVTQLGRAESRMAAWDADVQEWVTSAKSEMEKLDAEAVAKR